MNGTLPHDDYDARFVTEHLPAYLHIGPGVAYLLIALLQLVYPFRRRHYELRSGWGGWPRDRAFSAACLR